MRFHLPNYITNRADVAVYPRLFLPGRDQQYFVKALVILNQTFLFQAEAQRDELLA